MAEGPPSTNHHSYKTSSIVIFIEIRILQSFLNEKGYPPWTPVCRVVEDAEDNLFRNCFSNWPKDPSAFTLPNFLPCAMPKKNEQKVSVDLSGLYNRKRKQELLQEDIKDDGTGKVKVRI